jgi:hypothetical protein
VIIVSLHRSITEVYCVRQSGDMLVHHGRHFGRTVYAMCNVRSLITNTVLRLGESEDGEISEESLTSQYVLTLLYASPHSFPVM